MGPRPLKGEHGASLAQAKSRELSVREKQILGLAAAGLLDKHIAADLGISTNTLRTYWGRIRNKCGNLPRGALTAAFAKGELTPGEGGLGLPNSKRLLTETTDPNMLRRAAIYYATGFQRVQDTLSKVYRASLVLAAYPRVGLRSVSEPELLSAICRLFVEEGGYVMAWIGFPEHDPGQLVKIVASAGSSREFLDGITISWGDNELGHGPSGTAVRSGEIQCCRDFLADPTVAPWRDQALLHGFQSMLAVPLKNETEVLGVLSVFAREPDAFCEGESKLFEIIGTDLAIRLHELRKGGR